MKKRFFILFVCLFTSTILYSQSVGIKTNLLMDVTRTLNLGVEVGLGKKSTLDISANYNPWESSNGKLAKLLMLQPEYRFWTCEKFNGHFFGVHAHGGVYQYAGLDLPFNIAPSLKDHRYKGNFFGAGISYGYQWILGKHWNLEASLGIGYIRAKYEKFKCINCLPKVEEGYKNYFGPTKAAVSLIYLF